MTASKLSGPVTSTQDKHSAHACACSVCGEATVVAISHTSTASETWLHLHPPLPLNLVQKFLTPSLFLITNRRPTQKKAAGRTTIIRIRFQNQKRANIMKASHTITVLLPQTVTIRKLRPISWQAFLPAHCSIAIRMNMAAGQTHAQHSSFVIGSLLIRTLQLKPASLCQARLKGPNTQP
jgi:hypothetical protein